MATKLHHYIHKNLKIFIETMKKQTLQTSLMLIRGPTVSLKTRYPPTYTQQIV